MGDGAAGHLGPSAACHAEVATQLEHGSATTQQQLREDLTAKDQALTVSSVIFRTAVLQVTPNPTTN